MATLRFGLLPSEPLKINEIFLRKLLYYSGASFLVFRWSGVGVIWRTGDGWGYWKVELSFEDCVLETVVLSFRCWELF